MKMIAMAIRKTSVLFMESTSGVTRVRRKHSGCVRCSSSRSVRRAMGLAIAFGITSSKCHRTVAAATRQRHCAVMQHGHTGCVPMEPPLLFGTRICHLIPLPPGIGIHGAAHPAPFFFGSRHCRRPSGGPSSPTRRQGLYGFSRRSGFRSGPVRPSTPALHGRSPDGRARVRPPVAGYRAVRG